MGGDASQLRQAIYFMIDKPLKNIELTYQLSPDMFIGGCRDIMYLLPLLIYVNPTLFLFDLNMLMHV